MHSNTFVSTANGFKIRHAGGTTETTVIDGTGIPFLSPKATVAAHTGTGTIAAADFAKNHTNTGSSGTIVLTLPAAADVKGQYCRIQTTVAQIIQALPVTGEKIYLGGDGVASKYLNIAAVIGNTCLLYSDGTDFLVISYAGVLTKES